MAKKAIFPGSFDPITLGHYDIIRRASLLFDEVIVALGINTTKPRFIPIDTCVRMIEETFKDIPNVSVIQYNGLTVELCNKLDVNYIVRGIRNVSDFEFERSLAEMNRKLNPEIETLFLDSRPEYVAISSTIIREVYKNDGDISLFVPKAVVDILKEN